MVKQFNERTQLLIKLIGRDNVPGVMLSLKGVTNLGVDGANISTELMINQRIRGHSPRAITHHCGPHKAELVIKHSTDKNSGNRFLSDGHELHKMLANLVKSSSIQRVSFMEAQEVTKEYLEYGRRRALEFPARPMFR